MPPSKLKRCRYDLGESTEDVIYVRVARYLQCWILVKFSPLRTGANCTRRTGKSVCLRCSIICCSVTSTGTRESSVIHYIPHEIVDFKDLINIALLFRHSHRPTFWHNMKETRYNEAMLSLRPKVAIVVYIQSRRLPVVMDTLPTWAKVRGSPSYPFMVAFFIPDDKEALRLRNQFANLLVTELVNNF